MSPSGLAPTCSPSKTEPCIIVHGGAWNIPEELSERSLAGVRRAVQAGHRVLERGGSALDAVQAAVVILEDDPVFDAGRGSCLNARRGVEMDAIVMTEDPSTPQSLRAGAVAAVSNVANPVVLARAVMERTEHCLLVGPNADDFATEAARAGASVRVVDKLEELVSAEAVAEWEAFNRYDAVVTSLFNGGGPCGAEAGAGGAPPVPPVQSGHDTVGAVALDCEGRFAAATSTGGITNKMAGRVGDSPIIGSGAYVDAQLGAVSTTGHGESIMKTALAKQALDLVEHGGLRAAEAADGALLRMRKRTGGCGGLIIIDREGRVARRYTTERMAWASIEPDRAALRSGIDEEILASPVDGVY